MKDFALILRNAKGQTFGISGEYILRHEPPAAGCTNHWLFNLPDEQTLEVIIVERQKAELAVWVGHWIEVLKAHVRRIGTSLSQI